MKKIVLPVMIFTGLFFFSWVLATHIAPKEETRECLQWQRQAEKIPEVFWITPWQKEQCDRRGVIINAPVKRKEFKGDNNGFFFFMKR